MSSESENKIFEDTLRDLGYEVIPLSGISGRATEAPCNKDVFFLAQVLFAHRKEQDFSEEEAIVRALDLLQIGTNLNGPIRIEYQNDLDNFDIIVESSK